MDLARTERDVDRLDFSNWPMRSLAHLSSPRQSRFQVVIRQTALEAIHQHGLTTTQVEVCGVLVGDCCRDAFGPFLHIEAAVRGTAAASKGTSVTFTADTWTQIQNEMDAKYPGQKIVGWYHTHPGFGIFLSDMDVFIQENFFNLPWQTALVFDPLSGDEGIFVWRENKSVREEWIVEHDPKLVAKTSAEMQFGHDKIVELMIRVRRLERRLKTLAMVVFFAIAFALAGFWWALPTFERVLYAPATQPILK